jgi:hypothetical protein
MTVYELVNEQARRERHERLLRKYPVIAAWHRYRGVGRDHNNERGRV